MEGFEKWMQEGFIESREIEGEAKIFKNFLPNLLRDNIKAQKRVRQPDKTFEKITNLVNNHIDTIIENSETSESQYLKPVKNKVLMKLKIKPNAVPEGETIRVWMPFPRKDSLQPRIKLISTTPKNHVLASEDASQRTIYFERKAVKDKELKFQVEYEYIACVSYQKINPKK